MCQPEGLALNSERMGEACGVFGIYAPGEPVASLTYQGLTALQHRGEDAAGIIVSDGRYLEGIHGFGKVHEAFGHAEYLRGLPCEAFIAAGHTLYGTSVLKEFTDKIGRNIQPMLAGLKGDGKNAFALGHNGHVERADLLAQEYNVDVADAVSDTEIIQRVIEADLTRTDNLEDSLERVLPELEGAFSLVLATRDRLIAARDPHGFRPYHLGRYATSGWVVSSEIPGLDIIGAQPVREIGPGEILTISGSRPEDLVSRQFAESTPNLCSFEFVYFSRPDNEMHGELVYDVRVRMGALLARREKVEADMVLGVPQSGLLGAHGYSLESRDPENWSLVKNNYADRTFIAPTQDARDQKLKNKLNPIERHIKGQRLIVVDDSIVRGTVTRGLVKMLRDKGAAEVHLRILSPPYRWPCYFGMDTGRADELIAGHMTVEEIRAHTGADSLLYTEPEDMMTALGGAAGKVCTACTTGLYPIDVKPRDRQLVSQPS